MSDGCRNAARAYSDDDRRSELHRSHPSAPPVDVIDLVMKGRQGQRLNFIEIGVRCASLADPSSEFGQAVERALDEAMSAAEWAAFTSDRADPLLRDACLDVWRSSTLAGVQCGRAACTRSSA
jgi:hypothetical protein